MKKAYLTLLALFFIGFSHASDLENLKLTNIKPEGWLLTMMEYERDNFVNPLHEQIMPFRQGGWGSEPFLRKTAEGVAGFWVPYEQSGYYYDGVTRLGYLLDDEILISRCRDAIYGCIEKADENGILQSDLWQGERRRWSHSVFFRSWMAEYESTGDQTLLDALERHFINDTVTLVGRDRVNAETMYWLYTKTKNEKLKDMVLNLRVESGNVTNPEDQIGDFASDDKQEIHGVTYNEMLKLHVLYYELTGDKKELETVRNGFRKLDKYHMLPSGVNSSEEGTSGKGAQNTHEICDVVDYMWTCSYMLKATGETEWADRMERAMLNAGLGSITKNFDAHQYYSCSNQVVCGDYSCHVSTYPQLSRLAYRLMHRPPCCTGNITRMLPIYVSNQWLKGDKDALYKAIYGPGSVDHKLTNGEVVTLRERSVYPYTDEITIEVSEGSGEFPLYIRIPSWAVDPTVMVNGAPQKGVKVGEYYRIKRNFAKGDVVSLTAPKEAEFINWDGYESMVVNYGPLLFALPVEAKVVQQWVFDLTHQKEPYMGYTMNPASDWNYILGVDGTDNSYIKVTQHPIEEGANPWAMEQQPLELTVPMYQDPSWKLRYQKVTSFAGDEVYAALTPPLPARGAMIYVLRRLEPEAKKLVPYGSTCLRVSMFPFWREGHISAEILATE